MGFRNKGFRKKREDENEEGKIWEDGVTPKLRIKLGRFFLLLILEGEEDEARKT